MRRYEQLKGNWGLPPTPSFVRHHHRQYIAYSLLLYVATFLFALLSTQSYLAWAIMVLAVSLMVFLDLSEYHPHKALLSHTILGLAVLYIHVYVLFEQTSQIPPFFPPASIRPYILFEVLLGGLAFGRVVVGLVLVDELRTWKQCLAPTSPHTREVLKTYLKLGGKFFDQPSSPPSKTVSQFYQVLVGSFAVAGSLVLAGLLSEVARLVLFGVGFPASLGSFEFYPFIPLLFVITPTAIAWAWWLYQAAKNH